MVGFHPLNATDVESVTGLLYELDSALQYGEDREPQDPVDEYVEDD